MELRDVVIVCVNAMVDGGAGGGWSGVSRQNC